MKPKTFKEAMSESADRISTKNVFHSEGGGEFVAAGTIVDPDMKDAATKGWLECARYLLGHEAVKTIQRYHFGDGTIEREHVVEALNKISQLAAEVESCEK